MAIGNRNYVRKNYGHILDAAMAKFDELIEAFRTAYPRSSNAKEGRVHLSLEVHHSKNTWAYHGVVIYRNPDGTFAWYPRSFYGYAVLSPREWGPILGVDAEKRRA